MTTREDQIALRLAKAVLDKSLSGPSFGIDFECGICGGDSRSSIPHSPDCPVHEARRVIRMIESESK